MTVYLPIIAEIFVGLFVPAVLTCWIVRRRNEEFKLLSSNSLRAAGLFVVFLVIFFVPGLMVGMLVSCKLHPGQDCEHYHDPCLREARAKQTSHNCPGHI